MALTNKDASWVLGMVARGDKRHDIAAFFGENQARIAEVEQGAFGPVVAAPKTELPPKGPPGVKGRRARYTIEKVKKLLEEKGDSAVKEAIALLDEAIAKYDRHEA